MITMKNYLFLSLMLCVFFSDTYASDTGCGQFPVVLRIDELGKWVQKGINKPFRKRPLRYWDEPDYFETLKKPSLDLCQPTTQVDVEPALCPPGFSSIDDLETYRHEVRWDKDADRSVNMVTDFLSEDAKKLDVAHGNDKSQLVVYGHEFRGVKNPESNGSISPIAGTSTSGTMPRHLSCMISDIHGIIHQHGVSLNDLLQAGVAHTDIERLIELHRRYSCIPFHAETGFSRGDFGKLADLLDKQLNPEHRDKGYGSVLLSVAALIMRKKNENTVEVSHGVLTKQQNHLDQLVAFVTSNSSSSLRLDTIVNHITVPSGVLGSLLRPSSPAMLPTVSVEEALKTLKAGFLVDHGLLVAAQERYRKEAKALNSKQMYFDAIGRQISQFDTLIKPLSENFLDQSDNSSCLTPKNRIIDIDQSNKAGVFLVKEVYRCLQSSDVRNIKTVGDFKSDILKKLKALCVAQNFSYYTDNEEVEEFCKSIFHNLDLQSALDFDSKVKLLIKLIGKIEKISNHISSSSRGLRNDLKKEWDAGIAERNIRRCEDMVEQGLLKVIPEVYYGLIQDSGTIDDRIGRCVAKEVDVDLTLEKDSQATLLQKCLKKNFLVAMLPKIKEWDIDTVLKESIKNQDVLDVFLKYVPQSRCDRRQLITKLIDLLNQENNSRYPKPWRLIYICVDNDISILDMIDHQSAGTCSDLVWHHGLIEEKKTKLTKALSKKLLSSMPLNQDLCNIIAAYGRQSVFVDINNI